MRLTTIYITIYLFIIINCATQFEEKYTKKPKTLEAPTTEKGMDNDLSKTEAQNLWDKLCMSKVDQTQRNAFLAQNLHKISETQLWDLAAADINDLPATVYKNLNDDLKFGWLKNTHLTNEQKKMLSKLSDYKPAR